MGSTHFRSFVLEKYFAAQVKENGIHIKDNVVQKEEPVVVKLVSEVQNTYNRAQAVIKHEQKIEKQRRAVQEYDLNIPARKQGTVEKAFQYRIKHRGNPYKKMRSSWKQTKYNVW